MQTAQMAVKMVLEPRFEKIFHPNSFGYRPGRSAKDAVAQARQNCWRFDWVLDLDIKAFFDTIDHELLMRAVEKHVPEKWIRLYIKRWLEMPVVFNIVVAFIYPAFINSISFFSGFNVTKSGKSQFRMSPLHRFGSLALADT
ncbi:MAG: hypothetical protein GY931_14275 [Maribacter sp.]|nr:hypothetical protein [Maribacter sp.]